MLKAGISAVSGLMERCIKVACDDDVISSILFSDFLDLVKGGLVLQFGVVPRLGIYVLMMQRSGDPVWVCSEITRILESPSGCTVTRGDSFLFHMVATPAWPRRRCVGVIGSLSS